MLCLWTGGKLHPVESDVGSDGFAFSLRWRSCICRKIRGLTLATKDITLYNALCSSLSIVLKPLYLCSFDLSIAEITVTTLLPWPVQILRHLGIHWNHGDLFTFLSFLSRTNASTSSSKVSLYNISGLLPSGSMYWPWRRKKEHNNFVVNAVTNKLRCYKTIMPIT